MDGVAELFARIPHEVRRAGGSLLARLAVLVVALALNIGFFLPSIPAGVPGAGIPGIDKVVHVVVLALPVWAVGRVLAAMSRFPMGWVVLVAALYTVLVELIQLALPGRGSEVGDVIAGWIGIALGVGLWILERRLARDAQDREEQWPFEGDSPLDHPAQAASSSAPSPRG